MIVSNRLLHDLFAREKRNHLQVAVLLLRVHDQDLGQQRELLPANFHTIVADDTADHVLEHVALTLLVFID